MPRTKHCKRSQARSGNNLSGGALDQRQAKRARVSAAAEAKGTKCTVCMDRVGTDRGTLPNSRRCIAELQCGHRLCRPCLEKLRLHRVRMCTECRSMCLGAKIRRVGQPMSRAERTTRREALRLFLDDSYETIEYETGEESEAET